MDWQKQISKENKEKIEEAKEREEPIEEEF